MYYQKKENIRITQEMFEAHDLPFDDQTENYLGQVENTRREDWGIISSTLFSSLILQKTLTDHASALVRSAEASETHAKSLTIATWVLAAATIVLALTTIYLATR